MIPARFFLVGCPRSGTTLLQALIAAHPQITSFPETHFFWAIDKPWRVRLGLASRKRRERARLLAFIEAIDRPDLLPQVPQRSPWLAPYVQSFLRILDGLALERNKSCWLEKTPGHLQRIRIINHFVPGARYVHIVRNGDDTVASLFDVCRNYPQQWGSVCDLDWCIERWNHDVRLSAQAAGKPNHLIVRYEKLVADPEATLREVFTFLGQEPYDAALAAGDQPSPGLILANEPWKREPGDVVVRSKRRKFMTLDPQEQATIQRRVLPLDQLLPESA